LFQEGQQIGLYTLIRKLGRGGFGEVWLAERRTKFVTTRVAVKLPINDQIDHDAIKQEATLWEQASGHPNVLPIIDADEYDGQIVIVSEYAEGGSLDGWLKQHGKMSIENAVETTIRILDGLDYLHSRKIIHRDLKPANILLQGKIPRLADFGISRALRTTETSQSQNISGTFAYMSPESFDGKRSAQTDIWAAGVNLYQFLTGQLPFPAKEPSALIASIMMREPEPLPDEIPQGLKDVVSKALEKLPENRYKTAGEMRVDLKMISRTGLGPASFRERSAAALSAADSENQDFTTETIVRKVELPAHEARAAGGNSNVLPDKSARPKSKIIGSIIWLAIAAILFLALYSYNPMDPSFNTASSQEVQNWIGQFGANIADFALVFLGLSAYLLPAAAALIGWHFYRPQRSKITFGQFVGFVFLLISISDLFALNSYRGGILGSISSRFLIIYIGNAGATVVIVTFAVISLLLVTKFSLISLFRGSSRNE